MAFRISPRAIRGNRSSSPIHGTRTLLKIAVYHNLPSGGARRAMVEMIKGLVARDHTVDEYCPQTADLSFLPLNGIVRRTVILPFHPLGVASKRVPFLTPYITSCRLVRDLSTSLNLGRHVARLVDHGDYDVVLSHDCQLVVVPDVLQFLHVPTVHYCHSAGGSILQSRIGDSPDITRTTLFKRAYYAPALRIYPWLRHRRTQHNLRSAQLILTNSSFAKATLFRSFGVESQVCYLGVDISRFRPMALQRHGYLLSVGAVHYHKGYQFLIKAISRLPVTRRPPLVIAANSVEHTELQAIHRLARELSVDLSVCHVSNDEELAALYNGAVAFVYSPLDEPWGLAAVEAMACGTVVVAVGQGGVAESVVDGESGFLTLRDTDAFAAALGRVLSDPELANRMGRAGTARARSHFTWSQSIDRLERHLCAASGTRLRH